ncbi:hypothetical protein ABH935_002560 [Catenulispora sp. GAS73]|uniref:hypothetical protein n=1 Tax=Catenulispora sp. GAS73 TaxID=3156269 RepID=UPI003516AF35
MTVFHHISRLRALIVAAAPAAAGVNPVAQAQAAPLPPTIPTADGITRKSVTTIAASSIGTGGHDWTASSNDPSDFLEYMYGSGPATRSCGTGA